MRHGTLGGRIVLCAAIGAIGDVETIYGLVDPSEPERVRYVGRSVDPATRYRTHCRSPNGKAMQGWVGWLATQGRWPVMVELERHPMPDDMAVGVVSEREEWWIRQLRTQGQADLNRMVTCGTRRRKRTPAFEVSW